MKRAAWPNAQKELFFFFSSRRRHTRCSRDWSSDVCSSDLGGGDRDGLRGPARRGVGHRGAGHGRPGVRPARALWAAARASGDGDRGRPDRRDAPRQEGTCVDPAVRVAARGGRDARKREDRMDGGGAGAGRAGGAGSDTVITNLSTTSTRRVQFADEAPVAACTFPFPQSVWIVDKRRNDVPARNL